MLFRKLKKVCRTRKVLLVSPADFGFMALLSLVFYWLMSFWHLDELSGKGYAPLERFALGRTDFSTMLVFAMVFDAL